MDRKISLPIIQSKHLNNNQLPIPNVNVTPDTNPSNYCYQSPSITPSPSVIDDSSTRGSPRSNVMILPSSQFNPYNINNDTAPGFYSYPGIPSFPHHLPGTMSTGHLLQQPIPQTNHNLQSFQNLYQQTTDINQGKLKKKARIDRKCLRCGTSDTPEWRTGPYGSKTLCNACGLYHYKLVKKKGILFANNELLKYKIVLDKKGRRVAVDSENHPLRDAKEESPILQYSPNHLFQYHPITTTVYSSQDVGTLSPGRVVKNNE